MTVFERLLGYLHGVFDKDPAARPALRIGYDGALTWTVADGVLALTATGGTGQSARYVLAAFTLDTLATTIEAATGYTATVLEPSLAARGASVLVEGAGTAADAINAATSILWAILRGFAGTLKGAADDLVEAVDEIYLDRATGEYLDTHGDYFGVFRLPDETDADYLNRLIATLFLARNNNIAIQLALAKQLGVDPDAIQILDAGLTEFGKPLTYNGAVNFTGAKWFNGRTLATDIGAHRCEFSVVLTTEIAAEITRADLERIIQPFKAAGTRLLNIYQWGSLIYDGAAAYDGAERFDGRTL